jgi:uncharacterized protein (TIGR00645 family)
LDSSFELISAQSETPRQYWCLSKLPSICHLIQLLSREIFFPGFTISMSNTKHSDTDQSPASMRSKALAPLSNFIFWSRWLQMPLYIGLIVAQGVYVFHFWVELVHLVEAVFGNQDALRQLADSVGYKVVPIAAENGKALLNAAGQVMYKPLVLNETIIMLVVLALIDVVMISNLLIMVIVGGYETFVSRLGLQGHPDQPEWLSHVNASVLKVKLATAIIGISSIHLLKTFISAANYDEKVLLWQTLIHMAFLFSAMGIAACDRILPQPAKHNVQH